MARMEIGELVSRLWRRLWFIALGACLVGATAYLVSMQMPPVYEASTTLLISPRQVNGASSDLNALQTSESLARTYAWLLRSRPLLDEVIANLTLSANSEDLAERAKVTPVRDTQLILLTVEDRSAQRAANIANEIVRVFTLETRRLQSSNYDVLLVEPAYAPDVPISPRVLLNALLAGVVAAMALIGWEVLKAHLDARGAAHVRETDREGSAELSLEALAAVAAMAACSNCRYRLANQQENRQAAPKANGGPANGEAAVKVVDDAALYRPVK